MNNEMNNNINHNEQNHDFLLLQQQGLIDAQNVNDKLLNNAAAAPSPWFISLLFGFSGVFASLFFIGFLTLILDNTGLLDSTLALFIIGAILSVSGGFLFYNARLRHSAFWNSLAFAALHTTKKQKSLLKQRHNSNF